MMKWRQNLPLMRFSSALSIVLILLIGAHLLCLLLGKVELYGYVGLSTDSVRKGYIWTLGSYAFFHHPEDLSHLILNCFMLVYCGGRLTHILNSAGMLRICGAGIFSGALFHLGFSLISGSVFFQSLFYLFHTPFPQSYLGF